MVIYLKNNKEFRSKLKMKDSKIHNYFNGNKLLVENIVNDFSNYIYAIIRNSNLRILDEDIEELVSDVFFTIWRNKDKLDLNKKILPYIAGITKNLIKKKFRDTKVFDNIDDYENTLIENENIELCFIKNERNETIIKQLNKLKKEDKTIFILYYFNEKSINDISNVMNMSESKVKSKLFRTRKKLKKYLKERGYNSND